MNRCGPGRGHRRSQARDLMPAMLAVLTENGPAHSRGVLDELKRQQRVSYGTTMADAHEACELLVAEGKLAVGRVGGRHFKVPNDDRPRWDT